ncbi:MAG: MFS transporter [marine bacterium B5-7]|nr:MAG: MFS transporter [marine bacterium B5-7]
MSTVNHKKWWVLTAVSLLCILLNIDVTAVNLAIPPIAHAFHADLNNMQWIVTGYVLTCAIFTIPGGQFGDRFGHALTFNTGTILFGLASLLGAMSQSTEVLITARIIQGIAMGIAMPVSIALIYDVFPVKQYGLAMGLVMASVGFGTAVGPTLSGVLLHYLDWRWIFYINVPICLLTFLVSLYGNPKHVEKKQVSFDLIGNLVLFVSLLGLALAANQGQAWGFQSIKFQTVLWGGLLAFIVLYFVEKNKAAPAFDFSLFSVHNFRTIFFIRVFFQMAVIPIFFFIPIYLSDIASFSSLETGMIMLFFTAVLGISSPFFGYWTDKMDVRTPHIIATIMMLIATTLFCYLPTQPSLVALSFPLILTGLSCSLIFIITMNGAISAVSPEKSGVASGVLFCFCWLTCGIGVGIFGTIIDYVSHGQVLHALQQLGMSIAPAEKEALLRAASGIVPLHQLVHNYPAHSAQLLHITSFSFMSGFKLALRVITGFSLICVILSFFVDPKKPTHKQDVQHIAV